MTKLEKLKKQFETEDGYWEKEMESYKKCIEAAYFGAEQTESVGSDIQLWAAFIDIAAEYKRKMIYLDTEHKRFLRRWSWRFKFWSLIDLFKNGLGL